MSEKPTALSYDEAFAQLEAILASLEEGDLPLEQTLALYEEGAKLAAYCAAQTRGSRIAGAPVAAGRRDDALR